MGVKWSHLIAFAAAILTLAFLSLPAEREQGLLLFRDRAYARALPYLQRALQRDPDDRMTRQALARAARFSGNAAAAEAAIVPLLGDRPHDPDLISALAEIRLATGRYEEALALLKRISRTIADEDHILELYESLNALDEAASFLAARPRRGPDGIKRLERLARLHRWRQDLDAELEILQTLARSDPNPQRCASVMELALWLDRWDVARCAADHIAATPSASLECLRMARQFYRRDRRSEQWRALAERVCGVPAAEANDWLELAFATAYSGSGEEGLAPVFQKALERFPSEAMLARHFMWLAGEMGWRALAANAAQEVAKRSGDFADWRVAAQLLWDMGKHAEARALLDQRGGGDQGPTAAVAISGHWALQSGDTATARQRAALLFRRAQQAQPDLEAAKAALQIYSNLGQRNAQRALLAHLAERSASGKWACDLAEICLEANEPAEALAALGARPSPDIDPRRWQRLRGLALWQTASRLPHDSPERHHMLADAGAALAAAFRAEPKPEIARALVEIHLALRQPDTAWQYAAEAALSPAMWVAIAEAFIAAGQKSEADAALSRVAIPGLNADELPWAAFIYEKAGRISDAIRCLERTANLRPDDDDLMLQLADAYGRAGEREKQYRIMDERAKRLGEQGWLDAAERRLWNSDLAGEVDALKCGLELYPQSQALSQRYLQALVRQQRYGEAAHAWQALAEAGAPDDPPTLLAAAVALASVGEKASADNLYRRLVGLRLTDKTMLLEMARLANTCGRSDEALVFYDAYLQHAPDDGWAWYEVSAILAASKRDAGMALAKAWEKLPTSEDARVLAARSRILFWQGKKEEASRLIAAAVSRQPDNPDLLCEGADILLSHCGQGFVNRSLR